MVNVFVTQFAISIFGNVLALASSLKPIMCIIAGAVTLIFNLFLVYTSVWDTGAKDKPSIDAGRSKLNPMTGALIAIGAYLPSYILTVVYAILLPTASSVEGTASAICGFVYLGLFVLNGTYTGILSAVTIGGTLVREFWWSYLVISVPTILTCMAAYIMGAKDIHLTKLMLPLTPEEQEIKREKKAIKKDKD